MEHYVFDFSSEFEREVMDRFARGYGEDGCTPNPCIFCNRLIKFGALFDRAAALGIEKVATGHYAIKDRVKGKVVLKKALDQTKDQSYMLYSLSRKQLERAVFPLGGLRKEDLRRIGAKQGLSAAERKDSQDICFVPEGDYAGFIKAYFQRRGEHCPGFETGNFIDSAGWVLGRHAGHAYYTVGQRKGTGLAFGKPMYVAAKNPAANTVTLCEDEELYHKNLEAGDFNWIGPEEFQSPMSISAKIRYKHREQPAIIRQTGPDTVHVEFNVPQRAIARGQSVVLYDGDLVLGGGIIR